MVSRSSWRKLTPPRTSNVENVPLVYDDVIERLSVKNQALLLENARLISRLLELEQQLLLPRPLLSENQSVVERLSLLFPSFKIRLTVRSSSSESSPRPSGPLLFAYLVRNDRNGAVELQAESACPHRLEQQLRTAALAAGIFVPENTAHPDATSVISMTAQTE